MQARFPPSFSPRFNAVPRPFVLRIWLKARRRRGWSVLSIRRTRLLINAVSMCRMGTLMQRPICRSSLALAICSQYCCGSAFGKCQQDVGVPGAVQSERLVKLQIA